MSRVWYEALLQQLCQGAFLRPDNSLGTRAAVWLACMPGKSPGCVALARHESEHLAQ